MLFFYDHGLLSYIRVFSSFMRAHAKAMNEYRGGEMSTKVVVDRNLWTKIVDGRRGKWKCPASVVLW